MADETSNENPTDQPDDAKCETCGLPSKTGNAFAQLRKDVAERDERIDTLSAVALSNGIAAAGFEMILTDDDGNEQENKLLQLVTREFVKEHPQVETFDPKAFTQFAADYGVAPKAGETPKPVGGGEDPAREQAEALAGMHAQGEALRAASQQVQPAGGLQEQITQAQQAGDLETSKRLKMQAVAGQMLRVAEQGA